MVQLTIRGRVVLVQMTIERGHIVQSVGFENVCEVAASKYQHRMGIFADLPVCLGVKTRGGDQHAELASRTREMKRLVWRTLTPPWALKAEPGTTVAALEGLLAIAQAAAALSFHWRQRTL